MSLLLVKFSKQFAKEILTEINEMVSVIMLEITKNGYRNE